MAGAARYPDGSVEMNPDLFQGVEIVDVLEDRTAMRYIVNTVDGGRHIIAKEALQHLPTEDVLAVTRFQTRSRTSLASGERPWPDKTAALRASMEEMKQGYETLAAAEAFAAQHISKLNVLPKEMTVHPYEDTDKFGLFCPCGHGGIYTEEEAHFGVQRVCVKCSQRVVPNKPSDPHEGTLVKEEDLPFAYEHGTVTIGGYPGVDKAPTFTFPANDINVGHVPDEPDYTFDTYRQGAWRK